MSVVEHWLSGFVIGLGLRFRSRGEAEAKILALDRWAWEREQRQNLAGQNPNHPMSEHQLAEARAWGEGARTARGVNPPFPAPPYPKEKA